MTRSTALLSLLVALVGCSSTESEESGDQEIIGGTAATEYVEAATIDFTKGGRPFICSGAVVAPRVVLTAGHCVAGASGWFVRAGNASSFAGSSAVFDYVENGDTVDLRSHDVGLLFLDSPIELPRYPTIARSPLFDGSRVLNVGRILDGQQTDRLFGRETSVRSAASMGAPFDYVSELVIQPGDSGGPDFAAGTHTIVAVNSGEVTSERVQLLARVDQLHDFIAAQIATHGGDGSRPEPGAAALEPGLYGSLALAVHDGVVTGSVHEGSCEFTLAGRLGSDTDAIDLQLLTPDTRGRARLKVVDANTVSFSTFDLPGACSGVFDPSALVSGVALGFRASISAFGFRTILAERAFFHDAPGAPAGRSFVIRGQTVHQLGPNQGGFAKVRFTPGKGAATTGFLAESDLVSLGFSSSL